MSAPNLQVWAPVSDEAGWIIAEVIERRDAEVVLLRKWPAPVDREEVQFTVSKQDFEQLVPAPAGPPDTHVPDLVQLAEVSSGAVLHNLRARYAEGEIYTAIGPILVAVNPFRSLPLCTSAYLATMEQEEVAEDLPPHVFKTARMAYEAMRSSRVPQSIMVGGESGAGKTETVKLALSSVALLSGSSGTATKMALESGVVLEAFGNAKTVHNDNSSRFGKWCAVRFDRAGQIAGCRLSSFLLEKSRVVSHAEGERSYHLFYQLLAGSDSEERSRYLLGEPDTVFAYTRGCAGSVASLPACRDGAPPPPSVPGQSDAEEWGRTKSKLTLLGLDDEAQCGIFRLVACVLLLGNLSLGSGEAAEIDGGRLAEVASLLDCPGDRLLSALTKRMVSSPRGSSYTVPLTAQQRQDTRDALSKAVYASLFEWLLLQLNRKMDADLANADGAWEESQFIGFLDVFGFENFETNSFEQLCINFANEKLQGHFVDAVGRLQQQDYAREGLDTADLAFPDNGAQIALIEGKLGVMSLLDEEGVLPKGSEAAFVEKLHKGFINDTPAFSGSSFYQSLVRGKAKAKTAKASQKGAAGPTLFSPPSRRGDSALQFGVVHYAGEVLYTAAGWLDKNRLNLPAELSLLLMESTSSLVQALSSIIAPPEAPLKDGAKRPGFFGRGGGKKKAPTLISTFKASLASLSATLELTSARYIRCIKPNKDKVPYLFDGRYCSAQLSANGLDAVVEVQRSGFPVSLLKADFVGRYRWCAASMPAALLDAGKGGEDRACEALMAEGMKLAGGEWGEGGGYRLGKRKIFLKEAAVKGLERARQAVWDGAATVLQCRLRQQLAWRTLALVLGHVRLRVATCSALAALDATTARATGDSLTALWEGAMAQLPVASYGDTAVPLLGPTAGRMRLELGPLLSEVEALEGVLEARAAADAALKAALALLGAAGEEAEEWLWESVSSALEEAKAAHARAPSAGLASLIEQGDVAEAQHARQVQQAAAAAEAAAEAKAEAEAAAAKAAEEAAIQRAARGIESVGTGPAAGAGAAVVAAGDDEEEGITGGGASVRSRPAGGVNVMGLVSGPSAALRPVGERVEKEVGSESGEGERAGRGSCEGEDGGGGSGEGDGAGTGGEEEGAELTQAATVVGDERRQVKSVAAARARAREAATAKVKADLAESLTRALAMNSAAAAATETATVLARAPDPPPPLRARKLPSLSTWLAAVGLPHLEDVLDVGGIVLLTDLGGFSRADLAWLGMDAEQVDALWKALTERGPASRHVAGMEREADGAMEGATEGERAGRAAVDEGGMGGAGVDDGTSPSLPPSAPLDLSLATAHAERATSSEDASDRLGKNSGADCDRGGGRGSSGGGGSVAKSVGASGGGGIGGGGGCGGMSVRDRLRALEESERARLTPKVRVKPPSRGGKVAALQAGLGLEQKFSPMMLTPGLPPPLQRDEEGSVTGIGGVLNGIKQNVAKALQMSMTPVTSPLILVPDTAARGSDTLNSGALPDAQLSILTSRATRATRRPATKKPRAAAA